MTVEFVLIYIAIINLIAFIMMFVDKKIAIANGKAKSKKKIRTRIPETTLIMCAVMLGSVGELLGMFLFRHKTKHVKFTVGIPLCLIFNVGLLYFMYKCGMIV